MNVLDLNVVPDSLVYWHMTLTLLQVSWIGLVIGLIAATGNRVLRNRSANLRYWWNFDSLLAFAVSLPLTFAVVCNMPAGDHSDVTKTVITSVPAPQHGALSPTAPADAMAYAPDQPADSFNSDRSDRSDQSVGSDRSGPGPSAMCAKCQRIAKAASPFVAALYFIGVALMLIKLAIGVRISRSLRAASQPISDTDLLSRMVTQAKKLSLRIVPVIAYCEHVAVPIVIGLLRPMILVPTAMVNGLTTEELESVLTHELAHLRRHDHLLIVVQRVLEAMLFFHPVTWYLSRRIHDDRETCCDDLVLAIGGDRLHYAQSLLRVAELRLAAASRNDKSLTALAADGQRPSKLRQRIARLLGDSSNDSVRVSSVWLVAVLAAFVAASGWVINHSVYDLTSNQQLHAARLPLPAAASIGKVTGHVRDVARKPIAGATVAVRTTSVGIPKTMQAKTDSNGRFELALSGDLWPKSVPLNLWAWAPGYAVNVENVVGAIDDLPTPVNITLTVPRKVRFRVTDPQGNGVAGADVTPAVVFIRNVGMPRIKVMTELIETLPEFLRRTTDVDGTVDLDGFPEAPPHSVTIQSADYGIQLFDFDRVVMRPDGPNMGIILTLRPTTKVHGRLVGAPAEFLKGIQVDLRTDVQDQSLDAVAGFGTAITDDEGRFEVAAIASGRLSVAQHAPSDAEWRLVPNKHPLIAGTSPELEFVLKETVEMPFKIIRKDSGSPVAGVGIFITDESGFHEVATGISDERGEFRARVFEDTWNVATVDRVPAEFTPPTDENSFAWFPESPVRFQSPLAAAKFEVPVVPIEVPKGRLLQGQLVDPDNKPLSHWTVIAQRSRGETDADGKFRVMLRHNEVPSDWKTYSPENLRGVPKVISESPLVLQITDYSKAILPPGPENTVSVNPN